MMQRQDVDARAESQASRALGDGAQEDVLGRREAVDGGRVMLRQVIGVEPRGVEAFDLEQPLTIDLIETKTGHRLDVVEDAELHRAEYMTNFAPPDVGAACQPAPPCGRDAAARVCTYARAWRGT